MKNTMVISIVTVLMFQLIISGESLELQNYQMSFEHNSFDDQYRGCEKTMNIKAIELLKEERAKNPEFNKVWEKAENHWKNMSPDKKKMDKMFEIAVIAYTLEDYQMYQIFNQAVKGCCESLESYVKNFHFKAFHFYLTRAIQTLERSCRKVYRGVKVKVYPDRKGKMRFGQFASASKNVNVAKNFSGNLGTIYYVNTCEGASIEHLSNDPKQEEVLIPPYEEFDVTKFSEDAKGITMVHLTSKRKSSKYNCALVGSGNKATVPGQLTTILFSGVFILVFQAHSQTLTGF
ncbi:T-cell ecto-ADP-ribosyltransferase 2-like [Antechinus flavipes]|uniref:T-cell ecto-ADP-ribosyltransferase 2-like n=1 Tax=Antechinus flavipes TaxID=38775 RepID=UPI002235BC00|nr:T-cell ecto-ADP-ribosyltransferase 2-like [Antechinus flavipes]